MKLFGFFKKKPTPAPEGPVSSIVEEPFAVIRLTDEQRAELFPARDKMVSILFDTRLSFNPSGRQQPSGGRNYESPGPLI